MLRFSSLISIHKLRAQSGAAILCVSVAFLALAPAAAGQDFTLTMQKFVPIAVDPGGQASSNITLTAGTGFTGSVALSCQVTSTISTVTPPPCQVSPPTVTPSGSAEVTVLSSGTTTPGAYTAIVTGIGPSTTHQGAQTITVLAVNPAFTITIENPVLPTSVHAGSSSEGTVNVNPVFGYTGTVTLSCASITPLVSVPPVCQFNNPVNVQGVTTTTSITIITYGPILTTSAAPAHPFYALWLSFPMILLAGAGAALGGKKTRKAWGLFALFIVAGSLLLLPACSTGPKTNSPNNPNSSTPNGSYTFTLMGVDTHGNISSNTGGSNATPSVSLTVN